MTAEKENAVAGKGTENSMRAIAVEKVTANMGVGESGEELKKAMTILSGVSNAKPVQTTCKIKQPAWGVRPGLPIGTKVTLRRGGAEKFLKGALSAKENKLSRKNFDNRGNFGFGIKEHIDLPGVKYDPKVGIRGMDILVSLARPGYRIRRRKIKKRCIRKRHAITKGEAIDFVKARFGVEVE